MKKILILLLLLISIPLVKAEETEDLAPNAKSAIMIEASTGEILFQKNKDEKLAPASMTKMMSMLLIMEEIENGNLKWNEMITTSEKASSMGGSQIFLKVGEKMTVEDLLKGVAIASGNDAVVALAERVSGSEEQFVKRMNTRAKDLGLKNTNFINATGLTADNHYSSAYDMSLIAKELVKHEKILEFTSTYEDYLRKDTKSPFWLVNTNRLVRFKEGVDGLKTGFTDEAGYCLTATMKKDNMRLITVVMKEENTSKRSADTTKMLDYGFNIYMVQTILDEKTTIEKKKVELGKTLTAEIVPKENITILNKKSDDQKNITYKTNINKIIAPVKKGDKVGTIDIIEDNNIISTIDATVKEDISKANILTIYLRNLKEIISGTGSINNPYQLGV
ncbi:MAG: D-alanyl-D-alanine carboxypeptidase [Firmicutes bacterium]|nr:D-alanyl-D-alanine carboxypeptidase [Bacillota bacterium]MDY5336431.1 D-alanyl-D-alanine carboxypeptidase family protein [Bacilli bacterium]